MKKHALAIWDETIKDYRPAWLIVENEEYIWLPTERMYIADDGNALNLDHPAGICAMRTWVLERIEQ